MMEAEVVQTGVIMRCVKRPQACNTVYVALAMVFSFRRMALMSGVCIVCEMANLFMLPILITGNTSYRRDGDSYPCYGASSGSAIQTNNARNDDARGKFVTARSSSSF